MDPRSVEGSRPVGLAIQDKSLPRVELVLRAATGPPVELAPRAEALAPEELTERVACPPVAEETYPMRPAWAAMASLRTSNKSLLTPTWMSSG